MNRFSDLGIMPSKKRLLGDKIKISKILNREILIKDYRLEDSKYDKNKSGKCLILQIELEGTRHVIFTGSDVLIDLIEQVPKEKFPFLASIVQEGDWFEFK